MSVTLSIILAASIASSSTLFAFFLYSEKQFKEDAILTDGGRGGTGIRRQQPARVGCSLSESFETEKT
jgi:hypothetical protein